FAASSISTNDGIEDYIQHHEADEDVAAAQNFAIHRVEERVACKRLGKLSGRFFSSPGPEHQNSAQLGASEWPNLCPLFPTIAIDSPEYTDSDTPANASNRAVPLP